jgi:uncharacterized protein (UPF0305 family)
MIKTLADKYISFLDSYDPYRDIELDSETLSEMLYNLEEMKNDFSPDDELYPELIELITQFRMEGVKRESEIENI